jgi:hypothetical protein
MVGPIPIAMAAPSFLLPPPHGRAAEQ